MPEPTVTPEFAELASWTVADSRTRRCKRWSLHGEDVLDLTVAEMDFPVAEPIMTTLRDAIERQQFGYPLPDHANDLPDITAKWLGEQGLDLPTEQIRLMPDVIKGMVLAIKHLTQPDTPVLIITPTYSRFWDAVVAAERRAIEVPMQRYGQAYALDLAEIERGLKAGARTVLLCSPSNPVGRVFSRTELNQLAALVTEYGARTISDEVHAPLRYGRDFTPYAAISDDAAAHAITLTSASKAWNIPGLRCAIVALTNSDDAAAWERLPRASKGGISPLGIEATITAFTAGRPWLERVLGLLDTNRRLLADALTTAGLDDVMQLPEATYLAWFDLRRFRLANPQQHLLTEAGVATTDGREHGEAGAGFVRVNFATPPDVLLDAVERIARTLHHRRTGSD